MYLVDSFIPALAWVTEILEGFDSDTPELEYRSFRQRVEQLLRDHRQDAEQNYSHDAFQDGLFATACFIDELVMDSAWPGRQQWAGEMLQRVLFNTTEGGVLFFTKLDGLNPYNPVERDIREVYFYCLALGFTGQYFQPGDRARVDEIIATNAGLLQAGKGPEAEFVADTGDTPVRAPATTLARLYEMMRVPLLVGGPVLVFVTLFMMYRHQLITAANDLVLTL